MYLCFLIFSNLSLVSLVVRVSYIKLQEESQRCKYIYIWGQSYKYVYIFGRVKAGVDSLGSPAPEATGCYLQETAYLYAW